MKMRRAWIAWAAVIVLGVVVLVACKGGDRVAPGGATITVAATPTTIPLASSPACLNILNVSNCGTAQVIATVFTSTGFPLPDQDVRFSSTAGILYTGTTSNLVPASNTPIATDGFGNARVNLLTGTTSTVTARSGAASGQLTISTAQGNLSSLTLNPDTATCPSTTLTIGTCSQQVCLVAQALDTTAAGVPGVVLLFKIVNTTGTNAFGATFNLAQVITDSNGKATTTLTPDNNCATQCAGNKCIGADVITYTQSGLQSGPVHLNINIP